MMQNSKERHPTTLCASFLFNDVNGMCVHHATMHRMCDTIDCFYVILIYFTGNAVCLTFWIISGSGRFWFRCFVNFAKITWLEKNLRPHFTFTFPLKSCTKFVGYNIDNVISLAVYESEKSLQISPVSFRYIHV